MRWKAPFLKDAPVFRSWRIAKMSAIEDNMHTGLKPAKSNEADKKNQEKLWKLKEIKKSEIRIIAS